MREGRPRTVGSCLSVTHYRPLSQVVCDQLRQAIHTGELKPGQRLIQAELADRLGVSRIPVREALQRLTEEGLVEYRPRRGAAVRRPTLEEVEQALATARILVRAGMQIIVERITVADIEPLERLLTAGLRLAHSGRLAEAIALDARYHRELYGACGLPKLWECIEGLSQYYPQGRWMAIEARATVAISEQMEILAALRARDRDTLLDMADRHLVNNARAVLLELGGGVPDDRAAG